MQIDTSFSVRRPGLMLVVAGAVALLALSLSIRPAAAEATVSRTAGVMDAPAEDAQLQRLYALGEPMLLWDGMQYGQARQAVELLRTASAHGLEPSRYGIDDLSSRLERIGPGDANAFDRALSAAMLRFLTDLHFGRGIPNFELVHGGETLPRLDPVVHLHLALQQQKLAEAVSAAAPKIPLYKRVQDALAHYRRLAAEAPPWVVPALLHSGRKLQNGSTYDGLETLRQRLILLGDFVPGDVLSKPDQHTDTLVKAITRFQSRHGLAESGHVGPDTLAALAVPLSQRVRQLELTLERLRWIPAFRPGRIIIVNVATYRLWAFNTAEGGPAAEPLAMRVIVGKAARTPTPLFLGQMRYLEFNPYWNIPRSIALGEILPKLARNPAYLSQNGMEMVSTSGLAVPGAAGASVGGVRSGAYRIRQRPGAHNVLGAVKFAMPNPMNIYLHSTSAKELFGKARRDLSHGCIRVERPADLARFVLADVPQWSSAQAVEAAMQPGPTRTVRLAKAFPVIMFYATAASDRSGRVVFADDIYNLDDKLTRVLQRQ